MWGIIPSEQLDDRIWARIYQLYTTSYGNVVFKSPDQLKVFPCSIYYFRTGEMNDTPPFHANLIERDCDNEATDISSTDPNSVRSFMMVQIRSKAYKITLIGHDGTDLGMQRLFDKLAKLLVTPGYIFETKKGSISSKILRSRYGLMPVLNGDRIEELLDTDDRGDTIEITRKFKYGDPEDFVYYRHSQGHVIEGLLFGMGCPTEGFVGMEFKGPACERRCVYGQGTYSGN